MRYGDLIFSEDAGITGIVLIAEGNDVWAQVGHRICHYQETKQGKLARQYIDERFVIHEDLAWLLLDD